MAIPDFQSFMLPVLQALGAAQELPSPGIRASVAERLQLDEEDRKALLPSGKQTIVANRCAWATIHLERAGLLCRLSRGVYRITPRGAELLSTNPPAVNLKLLAAFPEYRSWRTSGGSQETGGEATGAEDSSAAEDTPRERLEAAHSQLRLALEEEVLSQVLGLSWQRFETLVVELLVRMGYGGTIEEAGARIGRTGDDGLDGVIKEDRLGFDVIYIQAKRWQPSATVGRPDVQQFAGSLEGVRARKGVFITTSRFADTALEYVRRIEKKIILIDGPQLARYMVDFNVGVTTEMTYEVKRLDSEFFADE